MGRDGGLMESNGAIFCHSFLFENYLLDEPKMECGMMGTS